MTPGEIDEYVRTQMAAGADLYTLHTGALAELDPDLILTQDLCRVCALPTDHVQEALDYLGCRADVISLDPRSLAEILDSITEVGRRAGALERAQALTAVLRARLGRVAASVAGRERPAVAVVEWVEPPFTAGHWIPDMIDAAGGRAVAARPGQPSVSTTWETIAAAAPDVIVVSPCGFHLAGAAAQAGMVVAGLGARLPAAQVWAIDADAIVVRPGPRVVDGVEALGSILHPDAVPVMRPDAVRRIR